VPGKSCRALRRIRISSSGVGEPRTTSQHMCCIQQHMCCMLATMTSAEFKRWLHGQGCAFETGKGGHLIVRRGDKMSVLPMHGKQKELGTGLVNAIKRDLGLK